MLLTISTFISHVDATKVIDDAVNFDYADPIEAEEQFYTMAEGVLKQFLLDNKGRQFTVNGKALNKDEVYGAVNNLIESCNRNIGITKNNQLVVSSVNYLNDAVFTELVVSVVGR